MDYFYLCNSTFPLMTDIRWIYLLLLAVISLMELLSWWIQRTRWNSKSYYFCWYFFQNL